jgi:hypothetical protein
MPQQRRVDRRGMISRRASAAVDQAADVDRPGMLPIRLCRTDRAWLASSAPRIDTARLAPIALTRLSEAVAATIICGATAFCDPMR